MWTYFPYTDFFYQFLIKNYLEIGGPIELEIDLFLRLGVLVLY